MGPCVRREDVLRVLFGLLAFILAWLAGSPSAEAHPHVWIVAKSEVMYAPDGSMTGVRHAWTFDDMFSTYALQGIETRTKGVYTREELKPLAQTNVESLKEFNFFTFAKADGKKTVDAVFAAIADAAAKGEEVSVNGFGKFKVKESAAREGRNPSTGATIQIAASKKLGFSAAKAVKDRLNG